MLGNTPSSKKHYALAYSDSQPKILVDQVDITMKSLGSF